MAKNTHEREPEAPKVRPARSSLYPWYDSVWLNQYENAKAIVRTANPSMLGEFVNAFSLLRTRPDFQPKLLEQPFDKETLQEIKRVISSLQLSELELHEAREFGRFVVHEHPFFTKLQQRLVPITSKAVGEEVEAKYNFLSLYTGMGVCPVHMDAPEAKWTVDLCIDQSTPWPIYFSEVRPWPDPQLEQWPEANWEEAIKQSPSLHFTSHTLQPGQALVFSGSSQWHYRDAIPNAGGQDFCNLLFFHFVPRGTSELIPPKNWARLFGIPELIQIVEGMV